MQLQTIIIFIKKAYFDFSFLLSRLFTKINDQGFLFVLQRDQNSELNIAGSTKCIKKQTSEWQSTIFQSLAVHGLCHASALAESEESTAADKF